MSYNNIRVGLKRGIAKILTWSIFFITTIAALVIMSFRLFKR